jgi:hypothetical protein
VGRNAVGQQKSFDIVAQEKFTIAGWAVDQTAKDTAGGVEIVIDDAPFVTKYGKVRPDVANAFAVPAYADAGYSIELLGQQFPPGAHKLFVRVLTHDRRAYWEIGPYVIDLK